MHYTVIILLTPDVVQGTANHLLELVTLYRDEPVSNRCKNVMGLSAAQVFVCSNRERKHRDLMSFGTLDVGQLL